MGNKLIEGLSSLTSSTYEAVPDILVIDFTVVKAYLIGNPKDMDNGWVLVDTGLENSAELILEAVENRFPKANKPKAIILTHGHFDHVGSVKKLSNLWDVPVYIHRLELPYITGKKDYPKADPSVDKGLVAKLSPSFPHTCIDIGFRAVALPNNNKIPFMPDWKWIPTPGHTLGHISLFREKDRVLIVGDAFTTTKQESLLSVVTQSEEINGPPKYFTTDWEGAKESLKVLQELHPTLAIPSHGKPIMGIELSQHLDLLIRDFDKIAKPEKGVFVHNNINQ